MRGGTARLIMAPMPCGLGKQSGVDPSAQSGLIIPASKYARLSCGVCVAVSLRSARHLVTATVPLAHGVHVLWSVSANVPAGQKTHCFAPKKHAQRQYGLLTIRPATVATTAPGWHVHGTVVLGGSVRLWLLHRMVSDTSSAAASHWYASVAACAVDCHADWRCGHMRGTHRKAVRHGGALGVVVVGRARGQRVALRRALRCEAGRHVAVQTATRMSAAAIRSPRRTLCCQRLART